ncbi:hypothetical protein KY306_02290 [Candidatus Woesearchaeota archaeon]|nr:hypothetical protein [Candidatus Woesearchaeota archaeon]
MIDQKKIRQKEVELLGEKYLVYLKRVATKIKEGGKPESTTTRVFVRKI